MKYQVLESCHSSWIFDPEHGAFRRVLKDPPAGIFRAITAWRRYYGLEITPGSDFFAIFLNPAGTRLLRSWHHQPGSCSLCGSEETLELRQEDLQAALQGF